MLKSYSFFVNQASDLSMHSQLNLQRFPEGWLTLEMNWRTHTWLQTGAHTHIQRHFPPAQLHLHSNCRQTWTDIWETKRKSNTQWSHVTPNYFGYSACSSDPEEIIKPHLGQAESGQRSSDGTASSFDLNYVNNDFNDDAFYLCVKYHNNKNAPNDLQCVARLLVHVGSPAKVGHRLSFTAAGFRSVLYQWPLPKLDSTANTYFNHFTRNCFFFQTCCIKTLYF